MAKKLIFRWKCIILDISFYCVELGQFMCRSENVKIYGSLTRWRWSGPDPARMYWPVLDRTGLPVDWTLFP